MFVRIDSRLAAIKEDTKQGRYTNCTPKSGTLAVIKGTMDFSKTDGYIQFMKLVLDNIPNAYGEQHKDWQAHIDRICILAEKLKDSNTRFNRYMKDEFPEYCRQLSLVIDKPPELSLERILIDIESSNDLVPFMEKHIGLGNSRGFYYEETDNVQELLMYDLMKQLAGIKFDKPSRNINVSYFLRSSGYHEHVHDALNTLISTAVYAINCSSTRERACFGFDVQTIERRLQYVEATMRRAENLV